MNELSCRTSYSRQRLKASAWGRNAHFSLTGTGGIAFLIALMLLIPSGAFGSLKAPYNLTDWTLPEPFESFNLKYHLLPGSASVGIPTSIETENIIVLRLQAPLLCIDEVCSTFVILRCDSERCPYVSILAKPQFDQSSVGFRILPDTLTYEFQTLGGRKIYVSVGSSVITASAR